MKHIILKSTITVLCLTVALACVTAIVYLQMIPIRLCVFPLQLAPSGDVLLSQKTAFMKPKTETTPLLPVILKNKLWLKNQTVLTKKGQEIWTEIEEWKQNREPLVLFPKSELKHQITQAGLFALPFLIEKETLSLELWVDVRKLLFQAPTDSFGKLEKFLMPFFYVLNLQSLDTLKKTLPRINTVHELITYAAFLQQGEGYQSFLESCLSLSVAKDTDLVFGYLAKFKEKGLTHLQFLMENHSLSTFHFYIQNLFLPTQETIPYLDDHIITSYVPADFIHTHAKWIALLRFSLVLCFIWISILCLILPFISWTFGRFCMHAFVSFFIGVLVFLASEKDILTSVALPVFQVETSMFPPMPFSFDLTTEKGDIKMLAYSIAMMLFFLFIQALFFIISLFQVSKIKHSSHSSSLKLALLSNEEALFDAGLYVGLSGTVFSLILLSFGLSEVGLTSAYTSTLFGIIQVAILKLIFVRPLRKYLLMNQTENDQLSPEENAS